MLLWATKKFYKMWKRVNFEIRVEKRVSQCGKGSISKLELKRGLHNVERVNFKIRVEKSFFFCVFFGFGVNVYFNI